MKQRDQSIPNTQLKSQREQKHWTQAELARMVDTTRVNVSRWEKGITVPSLYHREKLCELFHKSLEELGFTSAPAKAFPQFWNIPTRRNPFFTGREDLLHNLHHALHTRKTAALTQALSGLGGIGKTQIAIEYAYRFRKDYSYIFWVRTESLEVLVADFLSIAELLHLGQESTLEQQHIVKIVKQWLTTTPNWLVIFDNVEDFALVEEFIPHENTGHLILTTRTQFTGTLAENISVEMMDEHEGALFLLRRAKLLSQTTRYEDAPLSLRSEAVAVTELLGGLPLALDQAGAYIEETGCSLQDYLNSWNNFRPVLLNRRGNDSIYHSDSVTTTLLLSFQRVQEANSASVDLLHLCAFLHPDDIPEQLISEGVTSFCLDTTSSGYISYALDISVMTLRTYSLIQRLSSTKAFSIHRVVQTIIRDTMNESEQYLWAQRAVRTVSALFPDVNESAEWMQGQRYIPHALHALALIHQWNMAFPEAIRLLHQVGVYLTKNGQYRDAETLLKKARDLRVQVVGLKHSETAAILNDLSDLYFYQGKYALAESFQQDALKIREETLGLQHPDVAQSLNNLAVLYHAQGNYLEAKPRYQQALEIRQHVLGAQHPDVAESLNNLAFLHYALNEYMQAEPLYQQTLTIYEKTLGPEHSLVARSLNNLAMLYQVQGNYTQTESLHQRALAIYEKELGAEHPNVAFSLNNLARLYHLQRNYIQAEPLYQRALAIREKTLGPDHPDVATSLHRLAELYFEQAHYDQAERLYQQALLIREEVLGHDHPRTAESLNDLAKLFEKQGRYDRAEPLYVRAVAIQEQKFGAEHMILVKTLESYAHLLHTIGRKVEAIALEMRAKAIREKHRP